MIDVVDLHIHSRYSMATSKDMDLEHLSYWARRKGVTVLATGDITHPLWVKNLKSKLKNLQNGLFEFNGVRFVLSGEVNLIFKYNGKVKKVHILFTAPSFEVLDAANAELAKFGNLEVDGRPTLFTEASDFVRILKSVSGSIKIIPAHIWTPWFGVLGSKSGFLKLEDCFKDETEKITALETGLSSDPFMNYIVRDLDPFTLVSNSDAHSPENIAREANVIKDVLSYEDLFSVIEKADSKRFMFTLEFFPEEGKYFGDGHRKCNVGFVPVSNERVICPVCKKPLTYGVYRRVMESAHWEKEVRKNKNIPYRYVVPLKEIISDFLGKGKKTKSVAALYNDITEKFGTELNALVFSSEEELLKKCDKEVARRIIAVRNGNVKKEIGFDGKYGRIIIGEEKTVGLFNG